MLCCSPVLCHCCFFLLGRRRRSLFTLLHPVLFFSLPSITSIINLSLVTVTADVIVIDPRLTYHHRIAHSESLTSAFVLSRRPIWVIDQSINHRLNNFHFHFPSERKLQQSIDHRQTAIPIRTLSTRLEIPLPFDSFSFPDQLSSTTSS